MITIKNNLEFDELIKNNEVVIVDFYADWCGPCKMMAPFFEELSKEMTSITFAKLNVDELNDLAESFEITSIPTLIVFKNGKQSERHAGFLNKEGIINLLK
ncbi:thioredoxin [Mycoplasmoides pirum]|uniref:thioredoxin n=1 Tax=Mycoplasmoides pirum TaxID=2122 RepID=UPI0004869FFF|nr:thioredoxin [Mycoplasmoides pirum]